MDGHLWVNINKQNYMEEKKDIGVIIPPYIIRQDDRRKFESEFGSALNRCQETYHSLVAMQDINGIPKVLKDIDGNLVRSLVRSRLEDIDKATIMTSDDKRKAKQNWAKIEEEALGYIASIQNFIEKYPNADIAVNDGVLICCNYDAVLTEVCKTETPESVYKHVELILAVRDAIKNLNEFEKEHNFPTGSLYNVGVDINMLKNPSVLIENWLWKDERFEYIKKHPHLATTEDDLRRIRKATDANELKRSCKQYK